MIFTAAAVVAIIFMFIGLFLPPERRSLALQGATLAVLLATLWQLQAIAQLLAK